MKKMKQAVALVLALAFACLMLTACGGGASPTVQNYGEIMEQALTDARKDYGLSAVKFEESLESEAKKQYDRSVDGWQYVTIGGQKYKIVYILGGTNTSAGMQYDALKKAFKSYIEIYRNDKNGYVSNSQEYAGVEDLTHIGLWTNMKNGLVEYCLIGTLPVK